MGTFKCLGTGSPLLYAHRCAKHLAHAKASMVPNVSLVPNILHGATSINGPWQIATSLAGS